MSGIGAPALLVGGGGGGSSTITSFLGSTTNGPVNIAQVGGTAFALGQQLAASSLPVVLTASQLTTLTPPSNTGYALDSSLSTIDTDLKSNITLHAGTNYIGKVLPIDGTNALFGTAAALADSTTNPTLGSVQTFPMAFNGSFWDRIHSSFQPSDNTPGQTGIYVHSQPLLYNASGNLDKQRSANGGNGTTGTGLLGAAPMGFDGTNYQRITTNSITFSSKNGLDINLLGTLGTAFSAAGKIDIKGADGDIFVRQATASNFNATVVGQATGVAVPANAFYQGGIAKTALPSAASDGNLTGTMEDKFGRPVALISTIRDLVGTQTTTISASTSETTIVTAAASIFNDLVMLIVSNTSASTNTRIDFRDTTGGTVLFSLQSNGGQPPVGFALPTPIPQTSVNTNWTAQCATSTTDIRIYAVFAKNK